MESLQEVPQPKPWDFPRDSIHHSTPLAFQNNVPLLTAITADSSYNTGSSDSSNSNASSCSGHSSGFSGQVGEAGEAGCSSSLSFVLLTSLKAPGKTNKWRQKKNVVETVENP